jgi:hypothetical protein
MTYSEAPKEAVLKFVIHRRSLIPSIEASNLFLDAGFSSAHPQK